MPNEENNKQPNGLYKAYLNERSTTLTAWRELSKAYDTWLLTLSGGALALSMTFVKDIVSPNSPDSPGWLFASWMCLVAAILCIMIGLYQSPIAHEESVRILDNVYADRKHPYWKWVREQQAALRRPKIIKLANRLSLALFVLGVVFMSIFAYLNMDSEVPNNVSRETESIAASNISRD